MQSSSSAVRHALREGEQERRQRRGGDLRSRRPSQYALRAGEECEQQDVLALHRVRSGLVKERTAQANRLRGLLGEYGIVIGKGLAQLRKRLPELLEDAENDLSAAVALANKNARVIWALLRRREDYRAPVSANA
jgi:hypothetical protein